jgi:hypothetical protein
VKSILFFSTVLFAVVVTCGFLIAQVPDTLWTRTYGTPSDDGAYSVHQTNDKGFIITGYTDIPGGGGYGMYLLKTDSLGDTLWSNIFGGPQGDFGRSVQQTTDGGYIIVGFTNSFGSGMRDVYLVKTDSLGNDIWERTFGGNLYDVAFCVVQTDDDGYIITGYTYSFGNGMADLYLIKTNSVGSPMWTQTYGKVYYDEGWSVCPTSDGGYIVTGDVGLADGSRLWVIKTDSLGDLTWMKEYQHGDDSHGISVGITTDSCYIVTGYTYNPGNSSTDIWLLKIDSLGDTIWTRMYGGNNMDRGFSVRETPDGGFVIAGITWSYGNGYQDIYIVKTDSLGDTLWTRTYGGPEYEGAYSIEVTDDGNYVVVGYTGSFGAGNNDIWLLKLAPDVGVEIPDDRKQRTEVRFTCSPNPFFTTTTITLQGVSVNRSIGVSEIEIYDVAGRVVREISLLPFSFYLGATWDGCDEEGKMVAPGMYFLTLHGEPVGKVVKVR